MDRARFSWESPAPTGTTSPVRTSENRYPAWGGGFQYVLKPIQGIVANLEYAQGKDGNYGVYLKMGYAY